MKQDLISWSRNLGRIFKASWFQAFRDVLIVVGLFLRTQHSSRATWLATSWQNYPTRNPWFYEFFTGQPANRQLNYQNTHGKTKTYGEFLGIFSPGFYGSFSPDRPIILRRLYHQSLSIYIYISCEVHTAFKQRSQFEKNKHTEKTVFFKVFFAHTMGVAYFRRSQSCWSKFKFTNIHFVSKKKLHGWTFSNLKCLTIPCKITVIR